MSKNLCWSRSTSFGFEPLLKQILNLQRFSHTCMGILQKSCKRTHLIVNTRAVVLIDVIVVDTQNFCRSRKCNKSFRLWLYCIVVIFTFTMQWKFLLRPGSQVECFYNHDHPRLKEIRCCFHSQIRSLRFLLKKIPTIDRVPIWKTYYYWTWSCKSSYSFKAVFHSKSHRPSKNNIYFGH